MRMLRSVRSGELCGGKEGERTKLYDTNECTSVVYGIEAANKIYLARNQTPMNSYFDVSFYHCSPFKQTHFDNPIICVFSFSFSINKKCSLYIHCIVRLYACRSIRRICCVLIYIFSNGFFSSSGAFSKAHTKIMRTMTFEMKNHDRWPFRRALPMRFRKMNQYSLCEKFFLAISFV